MAKDPKKPTMIVTGPVAENRRARYDYEVLDTLEAGIMLTGSEVKSLRLGKAQMKSELADGALEGIAAVENLGAASREQVDALMDKGRDLVDSAAELIRERPLASFGVAFAAGWIIAKLARGSDR